MFESHLFPALSESLLRRQTRRQLDALSDHQLKDIGLVRGQIDDVAAALSQQMRGRSTQRVGLRSLLNVFRTAARRFA